MADGMILQEMLTKVLSSFNYFTYNMFEIFNCGLPSEGIFKGLRILKCTEI